MMIERMPFHNKHGLVHRMRECFWIISGKWSLQRAWQNGLDNGKAMEYHRLIKNKAYIAETKNAA